MTAEEIVRALAANIPDARCHWCDGDRDVDAEEWLHEPSCPVAAAREWVDAHPTRPLGGVTMAEVEAALPHAQRVMRATGGTLGDTVKLGSPSLLSPGETIVRTDGAVFKVSSVGRQRAFAVPVLDESGRQVMRDPATGSQTVDPDGAYRKG